MEEKELNKLFNEIRSLQIKSDPYMSTRVLAQTKSLTSVNKWNYLWKFIAGVSFTCCIALFSYIQLQKNSTYFVAEVETPQLVKVDIADLNLPSDLEVEIVLPEGVSFHSNTYAELDRLQSLRLEIDSNAIKHIPFVVKSEIKGLKKFQIKFYDKSNKLIHSKELSIKFSEKQGVKS